MTDLQDAGRTSSDSKGKSIVVQVRNALKFINNEADITSEVQLNVLEPDVVSAAGRNSVIRASSCCNIECLAAAGVSSADLASDDAGLCPQYIALLSDSGSTKFQSHSKVIQSTRNQGDTDLTSSPDVPFVKWLSSQRHVLLAEEGAASYRIVHVFIPHSVLPHGSGLRAVGDCESSLFSYSIRHVESLPFTDSLTRKSLREAQSAISTRRSELASRSSSSSSCQAERARAVRNVFSKHFNQQRNVDVQWDGNRLFNAVFSELEQCVRNEALPEVCTDVPSVPYTAPEAQQFTVTHRRLCVAELLAGATARDMHKRVPRMVHSLLARCESYCSSGSRCTVPQFQMDANKNESENWQLDGACKSACTLLKEVGDTTLMFQGVRTRFADLPARQAWSFALCSQPSRAPPPVQCRAPPSRPQRVKAGAVRRYSQTGQHLTQFSRSLIENVVRKLTARGKPVDLHHAFRCFRRSRQFHFSSMLLGKSVVRRRFSNAFRRNKVRLDVPPANIPAECKPLDTTPVKRQGPRAKLPRRKFPSVPTPTITNRVEAAAEQLAADGLCVSRPAITRYLYERFKMRLNRSVIYTVLQRAGYTFVRLPDGRRTYAKRSRLTSAILTTPNCDSKPATITSDDYLESDCEAATETAATDLVQLSHTRAAPSSTLRAANNLIANARQLARRKVQLSPMKTRGLHLRRRSTTAPSPACLEDTRERVLEVVRELNAAKKPVNSPTVAQLVLSRFGLVVTERNILGWLVNAGYHYVRRATDTAPGWHRDETKPAKKPACNSGSQDACRLFIDTVKQLMDTQKIVRLRLVIAMLAKRGVRINLWKAYGIMSHMPDVVFDKRRKVWTRSDAAPPSEQDDASTTSHNDAHSRKPLSVLPVPSPSNANANTTDSDANLRQQIIRTINQLVDAGLYISSLSVMHSMGVQGSSMRNRVRELMQEFLEYDPVSTRWTLRSTYKDQIKRADSSPDADTAKLSSFQDLATLAYVRQVISQCHSECKPVKPKRIIDCLRSQFGLQITHAAAREFLRQCGYRLERVNGEFNWSLRQKGKNTKRKRSKPKPRVSAMRLLLDTMHSSNETISRASAARRFSTTYNTKINHRQAAYLMSRAGYHFDYVIKKWLPNSACPAKRDELTTASGSGEADMPRSVAKTTAATTACSDNDQTESLGHFGLVDTREDSDEGSKYLCEVTCANDEDCYQ